jgi:hypothetical protein
MARNHYLTRKVQPGEIQPEVDPILAARAMAEAETLVAYGVRRGLLSYPHGTQFDQEGRPIPKLFKPERTYTKAIEDYPCLRAYLMADNGMTHVQVAREIRASTAKIGAIIAHGRAVWLAQKAALNGKEGQDTAIKSKRASGAARPPEGTLLTADSPRVGTLRQQRANAGAKTDRGTPDRKPAINP